MHLLKIHGIIDEFQPAAVVFDPLTNLLGQGSDFEVKSMATRLIDYLKSKGITALFNSLTSGNHRALEGTEMDISSFIDTWILLRDIELQGERNRGLYILKSRGMAHSNQIREFLITSKGIDLLDVYLGPEGVLTGTARANQESRERMEVALREQRMELKRKEIERKRHSLQAQLAALEATYAAEVEEIGLGLAHEEMQEQARNRGRDDMARLRQSDSDNGSPEVEGRPEE
jgi:circadian clock protein KaiC